MPSDTYLKVTNTIHRTLVGLTRGRVGGSLLGMPVVELTTTGAKSGLPRTSMLTSPYQDDAGYVIVASRGGDDHHPAWYHNLVAHPQVKASIKGGPQREMTAAVIQPPERDQIWAEIVKKHRNYAGYQKKTSRQIPLVRLS